MSRNPFALIYRNMSKDETLRAHSRKYTYIN